MSEGGSRCTTERSGDRGDGLATRAAWLKDPSERRLEIHRLVDGRWLEVETAARGLQVRAAPLDAIERSRASLGTLQHRHAFARFALSRIRDRGAAFPPPRPATRAPPPGPDRALERPRRILPGLRRTALRGARSGLASAILMNIPRWRCKVAAC